MGLLSPKPFHPLLQAKTVELMYPARAEEVSCEPEFAFVHSAIAIESS